MQCISLCLPTLAENRMLLYKKGIDLATLRIDYLDAIPQPQVLIRFAKMSPIPLILSWRLVRDGGLCNDDPAERLPYLRQMIESRAFAYLDIEHDFADESLIALAEKKGITVLRSYYDFAGIPENLEKIYAAVPKGQIPKIAVMIKGTKELIDFYHFTQGKEGIFVGLGHYGLASRYLYREFSSKWNYLMPDDMMLMGGQISYKDLERVGLDGPRKESSELFAIVGNPLQYTGAPKIHNILFKKRSKIGVFIPFPADDLELFMDFAEELGIIGLAIMSPFKGQAMKFAKYVEPEVKRFRACNTLVRTSSEPWSAYNTEHQAFINAMASAQACSGGPCYETALILGSGAASRMCLVASQELVTKKIYITSQAHGDKTAGKTNDTTATDMTSYIRGLDMLEGREIIEIPWAERNEYASQVDLVINTMPLNTERSNYLPDVVWRREQTVFDFVNFDEECTPLCKRAQEDGARVIEGEYLLEERSNIQHLLFVDAIRRERELS